MNADEQSQGSDTNAAPDSTDHSSLDRATSGGTNESAAGGGLPMTTSNRGATLGGERLPMLDAVVDRLGKILQTNVRKLVGDSATVRVEPIEHNRFGEYAKSLSPLSLFCVVRIDSSSVPCVAVAGPDFVLAANDLFLGSGTVTAAFEIARPFTSVERMLSERLVRLILVDLTAAFQPVIDIKFKLERVEASASSVASIGPADQILALRIKLQISGRDAQLDLVLPSACLEPFRESLRQVYLGEKFGRDQVWERHLTHELLASKLQLTAVLDEPVVPIASLIRWDVGSTLMLDATPTSHVKIYCGTAPRFLATMGRNRDRVVVRIESGIEHRGGTHLG